MKQVNALPANAACKAIANQLVWSATSVGANYRAAQRGRSKDEFNAKLRIVIEKIDECGYWLELIMEGELLPAERVKPLHAEAEELTAIAVAAFRKALSSS